LSDTTEITTETAVGSVPSDVGASAPTAPATVPAQPKSAVEPYTGPAPEGLEDVEQSDLVMPTLRIDHKNGVFVDALSGKTFESVDVVALGLIKQRVLWDAEVEEGSNGPLCRSYNFTVGIPDEKSFPWKASGFNPTTDGDTLPCERCLLKNWGSHPKRDAPWCSEQHTFAIIQNLGEGIMAPALLTVQRSAIKPSRTYLTSFMRNRKALFTVWTHIDLEHRSRGTVDFAVPKFVQGDPTDEADWPFYAQQYKTIREIVQTPRSRDDSEAEGSTDPASGVPVGAQPPSADDDELPF
jgi:hypothetical protein